MTITLRKKRGELPSDWPLPFADDRDVEINVTLVNSPPTDDTQARRTAQRAFGERLRRFVAEHGSRTETAEDAVNRVRELRDEWPE